MRGVEGQFPLDSGEEFLLVLLGHGPRDEVSEVIGWCARVVLALLVKDGDGSEQPVVPEQYGQLISESRDETNVIPLECLIVVPHFGLNDGDDTRGKVGHGVRCVSSSNGPESVVGCGGSASCLCLTLDCLLRGFVECLLLHDAAEPCPDEFDSFLIGLVEEFEGTGSERGFEPLQVNKVPQDEFVLTGDCAEPCEEFVGSVRHHASECSVAQGYREGLLGCRVIEECVEASEPAFFEDAGEHSPVGGGENMVDDFRGFCGKA